VEKKSQFSVIENRKCRSQLRHAADRKKEERNTKSQRNETGKKEWRKESGER
jgi:hypothetical protein